MEYTLELHKISKKYGSNECRVEALKNISLKVKKNEVVSLIGPSGSGKTSLLQIAGLLDNATSGKIIINNHHIKNKDDCFRTRIRKNNIGFIYQFHHLLPELSVLENVLLPLYIKGFSKKESLVKARQILKDVELENRVDFMPGQLSGGQQQRVAIARALVTKPSIILADEPTGNLDSSLSEKIFDLIYQQVKKYELSCIIVTHNQKLAKKADRIETLKDGVISSKLYN